MLLRTEEINYLNELESVIRKYETLREKPHLDSVKYYLDKVQYYINLARKDNVTTY